MPFCLQLCRESFAHFLMVARCLGLLFTTMRCETLMVVFALCLCHIVCLQLHVTLGMGGRGVILHFKRGHTT